MKLHKMRMAAFMVATGLAGTAQADLIDRGGGLIYDTDLDVTWLQDANYAMSSGYDADGLMTWSEAVTWVTNLSYYDSVRNVTYTDWRLPTTIDMGALGVQCTYSGTDCGYNVDTASSEMAHLFFTELGNLSEFSSSGSPVFGSNGVDWGLANKGPFKNFESSLYWSTEYASYTNFAWNFQFYYGYQDVFDKTYSLHALAVRSGDVAAVPEAETWALVLAGLALVGIAVRRRKQNEV